MLTPEQIKAMRLQAGLPESLPSAQDSRDSEIDMALNASKKSSGVSSFFSKAKQAIVGQAEGLKKDISSIAGKDANLGFSDIPRTALAVAGRTGKAIASTVGAGIETSVSSLLSPEQKEAIKNRVAQVISSSTGKQVMGTAEEIGKMYSSWKKANPGTARDLENAIGVLDLATTLTGGAIAKKGAQRAAEGVGAAVESAGRGAVRGMESAKTAVKGGTEFVKEGVFPTPTLEKALGEIVRAEESSLPIAKKALSVIDRKGVETYSDLAQKFNDVIPELTKIADEALSADPNKYSLDALKLVQKTKNGTEVKTDFVGRAINELQDLYSKLGDDVKKAEMDELLERVKTEGLTKNEVNQLARTYNIEYGDKAFTASGDIKSGFNAQSYETTRKGLKKVARDSIGGGVAAAADDALSAVYTTRRYVEKMANAVNDMKQKIETKGWIGKAVRKTFDTLDLLSGGLVRAVRDSILARGSAQKLQNALELESNLKRNLEVVNRALKADTEKEAVEILQLLEGVKSSNK